MKRPGVLSVLWLFRPGGRAAVGLRYESSSGGGEAVPSEAQQRAEHFDELLSHFRCCRRFCYAVAPLSLAAAITAAYLHPAADLNSAIGYLITGGGVSVAALLFREVKKAKQHLDEFRDHEAARQQVEALPEGPAKHAARIQLALYFARVPNAETNAKAMWQALLSGQVPQAPKSQ